MTQLRTPPEKPQKPDNEPGPDLPPPSRPDPGTPKPGDPQPGDPPQRPRPGDPTPTEPKRNPPGPIEPKSGFRGLLAVLFVAATTSFATGQDVRNSANDNDLLEAIEIELQTDELVSPNSIDVVVREGVVTLSGTAFTLLAKQRAVRLLSSLKGVRAIVDQTDVAQSNRSDQQVLQDAKQVLRTDAVTDSGEIQVQVSDGRVSLDGTVDSFAESRAAADAVAGVRGVTKLANNIVVNVKADRPDQEIEPEILRRFELDPYLAAETIDVKVSDGAVTLRGVVASLAEKEDAALLSWVAGVRAVDTDQLEVSWWQSKQRKRDRFSLVRNDVDLRRAVEDALLYNYRVRDANIKIRVRHAAVSLFGNVSSLAAKQAAEATAANTLGVRRVINHLKVKIHDWPGDSVATEQAQQALRRDAVLADHDLQASSHFGKVYLRGNVDTHFERERAGIVVSNVPSALEVVNRISVDDQWQRKSDDEISEDLERRLRWSPYLESEEINVSVQDGIVVLHGTVESWHQRKLAERQAHQAGARSVTNKLDVKSFRNVPVSLKAKLIPNKLKYTLDPRVSAQQLRDYHATIPQPGDPRWLPPVPDVDLTLRIENNGKRPIPIRVGHDKSELQLSLTGDGAIHVPLGRSFSADFRPGRVVMIEPGDHWNLPIVSLEYGFRGTSDRWYWTKPGPYMLQASYSWPADTIGINMQSVDASPVELTVDDGGHD